MNRIIACLALVYLCMSWHSTQAQEKRLFVQLGTGYALGEPSASLGTEIVESGSNTEISIKKGTFATGFVHELVAGIHMSSHWGFSMGMQRFSSNTHTLLDQQTTEDDLSITSEVTGKWSAWQLSPSVFLSTAGDSKWQFFTRFGLVLPLSSTITQEESTVLFDPSQGSVVINAESDTKTGFNLGYTGSIGASLALGEHLSLVGELTAQHLSPNASSYEITRLTVDGRDQMDGLDRFDLESNYVNTLDGSSNSLEVKDEVDPTQPEDELTFQVPMNHYRLNIGLRYTF